VPSFSSLHRDMVAREINVDGRTDGQPEDIMPIVGGGGIQENNDHRVKLFS